MTVQSLDHVNIRVPDPAATKTFLIDVLEMSVSSQRESWISDADGRPIIHLGSIEKPYPTDDWHPPSAGGDSGPVHHVALNCADYGKVAARLEARKVDHFTSAQPGIALRQIFVRIPGGVMLELNFWN
ncbi:catechol 2,3-dioxygenase-like lactoylglutathione lyase family enzyme [Sphingobium fontiphilum]|uniref:Catechol 2,3-dioxygenase-like lactoylglutathione lyase family enzyme n=1 Tax=Sphingobium fontiphilum TaxID=944425 RepID=A0A7W6DI50_9SPHN|nr:VOC family protein [Sphingobium fontiphilum]MBB3983468.1 catechol 2,3-dioxygenase-like lactoylglutathione lyase family enzyme [Sphingobium fontiphilum]